MIMYKVMLVDDDYPMLEFLEKTVSWEELGYQVIHAEDDSKTAFEKAKADMPDLIISDITMPYMNGIELISRLKQVNDNLISVILSCHDEFLYAQQAIKLGVTDYFIKETITPEMITALLKKLKLRMDQDRVAALDQERKNNLFEMNQKVYREKAIQKLMANQNIDNEDWEKLFGVNFQRRRYIPVCCYIHQYNECMERFGSEDNLYTSIETSFRKVFKKQEILKFFTYKEHLFIILPDQEKIYHTQSLHSILTNILSDMGYDLKIDISFIMETKCSSSLDIIQKITHLLNKVNQLFYTKGNKVFLSSELNQEFINKDIYETYHHLSLDINNYIMSESVECLNRIEARWQSLLNEGYYHPTDIKRFVIRIVQDLQIKLKTLSYFRSDTTSDRLEELMSNIDNLKVLEKWFLSYVKAIGSKVKTLEQSTKRSEIIQAQKYVNLHINQKVTLEEVANYLHLNPSYFSRLYKKETNEGFIEYVTRIKMEKAKEMIETNVKTVEEVAFEFGYNNRSYFNKCFKNYFGVSPNEYRASH
jgi:two-component system response regulator YesN